MTKSNKKILSFMHRWIPPSDELIKKIKETLKRKRNGKSRPNK